MFAIRVDTRDIGMVDRGGCARFPFKQEKGGLIGGVRRPEQLDCHRTAEIGIMRAMGDPEPAFADLLFQAVSTADQTRRVVLISFVLVELVAYCQAVVPSARVDSGRS